MAEIWPGGTSVGIKNTNRGGLTSAGGTNVGKFFLLAGTNVGINVDRGDKQRQKSDHKWPRYGQEGLTSAIKTLIRGD